PVGDGLRGDLVSLAPAAERDQPHLLLVLGQSSGDVGEPQEDGVADQVEEHGGGDAGLLHRAGAVAAAATRAAVLVRSVVAALGDALDEAVARDPATLLPVRELLPHRG